ncbi:MAG: immune inhibitor A [Ardenticatenaceae bacterium]|nr:immune inhibitor A [Ardenticatenaceae bacterium]
MNDNEYQSYTPESPKTSNANRQLWYILSGCLLVFLCLCCLALGAGYYVWTEYGDDILSEFGTATPERRDTEPDEETLPTRDSNEGREGAVTPTAAIAAQPSATPEASATPAPEATSNGLPSQAIDAVIPGEIDQRLLADRADSDLELLYTTNFPTHDYFETAVRLGGKNLGPRTLSKPLHNVGDVETFYNGSDQIEARLAVATEHVYFWVEEGLDLDQAELETAVNRLENEFYPQLVHLFGEVWTPGIDGDPHFSILHAQSGASDELGRFNSEDQYPKTLYGTSNEQELIYMNMAELTLGSDLYYGTLVHEVQHLIQWYLDASETVWLNEGLSQLAEIYMGFDDTAPSIDYLQQPEIQLNTWNYDDESVYAHYAGAYLFSVYLWEQLGDAAIQELARHPGNGMASVWDVLRGHAEPGLTLEQFTANWAAANYLDDSNANRAFYYESLNLRQPYVAAKMEPDEPSLDRLEEMAQFGVHYIDLSDLRGPTTITFAGDTAVDLIGSPARSGEQFWFAPGVDDMDAQLTATFDLSGVQQATLKYAVWYELEEDYDFAYVSVSADGGQTWEILRPSHYSFGDFGEAYNGRSADRSDAVDGWLKQSLNLNEYVGQTIQVRFELLTDGGITDRGFAIDDISIPELGYESNVDGGPDGWQANGFVQIGWQIPQRWSVLLIEEGPNPAVTPLALNPGNQGQWNLEIGKGGGVLVIMPQTPFTSETATYWLSVQQ